MFLTVSAAALAAGIGLSVLGHVSPVIQVIPFVFSIPGLVIAWLTYRESRADSARAELTKVADDLARTVLHQWEAESKVRQVNDADLLSVSWEPAATDLIDSWPSLQKRPSQVSGSDRELLRVLEQVPKRRLVVLGEPGSGKTVLLIRLLLALLRNRPPGTAVPVIVQLASWNPEVQSLRAWLISRLTLDYPSLKIPSPSTTETLNRAEALIDEHLLLILLDGLDEIPEIQRRTAIEQINTFLTSDMGIVVSCRASEYGKALAASGSPGRPMMLTGADGILLRPLNDDTIKDYILGRADRKSPLAQRWDPVFDALTDPSTPVAQAFRTPLIVALARSVYDPLRPEEIGPGQSGPAPADLCNIDIFPTRVAIESYLLRAFVRAAYEPRNDRKEKRWKTRDAEQWLAFLANHLRAKGEDYNLLAWWELQGPPRPWLVPAVVGTICGLASGLAAGFGAHVGFGIGVGLGLGAFAGLAVGIPITVATRNSDDKEQRPSVGIAGALLGALAGGLLGGLAGKLGIGHAVWPFGGLAVALAVAIGVGSSTNFRGGLAGGLAGGFLSTVLEGVGIGLPAGLFNGAGMGLCAALVVRYVGRREPAFRVRYSPIGLLCGLAIGIAVGLITGRVEGLRAGLLAGTVVGLLSSLPCGMTHFIQQDREKDKSTVLSPHQALRHDYRTFWMTAPPAAIAAAIAGLLGGGLVSVYAVKARPDLHTLVSNGIWIGVAAGIIIGLGFGLHHAASVAFGITRTWLALRRQLPWRLMTFLEDAHKERGILRQSGSVYQFRHLELMSRLAVAPASQRAALLPDQSTGASVPAAGDITIRPGDPVISPPASS